MFYAMFFSEVRLADEKHRLEGQLRSFDEQYSRSASVRRSFAVFAMICAII